ncbi:MAG: phosphoserine phosphatase RsbU/P [Solirubrobacteraceae bacterium]|nr:phosphoserine phosphatase RsbU/P [Solirubrobacteraceae bacterium]
MSADDGLLPALDTAEDLFENAPCGYLSTRMDGTIVRVNRTFESWTGFPRDALLGRTRFQDLLSAGGRIFHETHYAPLLLMQGSVQEIAFDIVRADGSRLPSLVNSVVRTPAPGSAQVVRTTVFDATDRRRYEQELLRARRREHDIAQQLQRSMLSGVLPSAPDLAVEVAYHPAERGLEVGGDWYDAFWVIDDHTAGLVIGDVVGRGLQAAAAMGQLRSAVRALASTGLGPAALLTALDRYAARHGVGWMTTLVYAELSLASGRLRYACAGHPPPIIVSPGQEPEFAWDGRSMPLAAHMQTGRPRGEATRELAPGSTVLLYTDGLIERRDQPLDEGMTRLQAALAAPTDGEPLTSGLVRSLGGAEHDDDVCLLAARIGGRG